MDAEVRRRIAAALARQTTEHLLLDLRTPWVAFQRPGAVQTYRDLIRAELARRNIGVPDARD